MATSRSYRLSPLAETDMEEVWRYSAEHWPVAQTDTYGRNLIEAFSDLLQAHGRVALSR